MKKKFGLGRLGERKTERFTISAYLFNTVVRSAPTKLMVPGGKAISSCVGLAAAPPGFRTVAGAAGSVASVAGTTVLGAGAPPGAAGAPKGAGPPTARGSPGGGAGV